MASPTPPSPPVQAGEGTAPTVVNASSRGGARRFVGRKSAPRGEAGSDLVRVGKWAPWIGDFLGWVLRWDVGGFADLCPTPHSVSRWVAQEADTRAPGGSASLSQRGHATIRKVWG